MEQASSVEELAATINDISASAQKTSALSSIFSVRMDRRMLWNPPT